MIVKKITKPMPAFRLGTDCALARQLTEAGLLVQQSDGNFRIRTRESMEEGELAKSGDYIKLDSTGMPYPTEKDWFEANHTQLEEDLYLQTAQPRKAWCSAEPVCPEIRFLLDRKLMQWDPEQGFQAQLWGTLQTAGPDAVVVFDRIETDNQGNVQNIEFHFVAADEFDTTYEVLSD